MEVTIQQCIELNNFCSTIKLNKVTKEARKFLLKNHFILTKVKKELEEFQETLREKMLPKEDLEEVQRIETELQRAITVEEQKALIEELNSHKETLDLISDYNKLVQEELKRNTDVELEKIDEDTFIQALVDSKTEFTTRNLETLSILFK